MNNTTDSQEDTKAGGVIWEGNTAWLQVQEARAAGDAEAEGLAMRRWSEAQTNASLALVGQVIKPLADQIGGLRLHLDNSDRARLKRNTEFQIELQERLDGHARVLDEEVKTIAASVEGAAQLAGKAYALAEKAEAGVVELAGIVSNQEERLDTVSDRLLLVEETPGTSPALLRSLESLSRDLQESKIDRTRLRGELRQTRYTVYVIVAVLLIAVLVRLWSG